MSESQTPMAFEALGVTKRLCQQLETFQIVTPTPIQQEAIPVALSGHDLIGIAQTGTGKTLAFGLPMMCLLEPGQTGLVMAPTRELALQIEETFRKFGVRTAVLIGGAPMGRQVSQLRGRPQVIVATPGRLLDHMMQRTVDLRYVSIAVLDEADRMLDMGFAPAIRRIMDAVPRKRQTMLFSATMPKEIEALANDYLLDPQRIEVASQGTAAELVTQELVIIPHEEKHDVLGQLLYENPGTVLVFARTRHGARKLAVAVRNLGHTADEIHSDRTLAQRRSALEGFKRGTYRVLVATDIAARGIDVKDITLVVNFDLPMTSEDYVHRIGRTGRAGAAGLAVTLATPDQHREIRDIERLLKSEFPVSARSTATLYRPKNVPKPPRTHRVGAQRAEKEANAASRPPRNDFRDSGTRPVRNHPAAPSKFERSWSKPEGEAAPSADSSEKHSRPARPEPNKRAPYGGRPESRGEGFASPEHRSASSNGPKRPWPANNSAPRPAGKPTGPRTDKPKSDGVPGNGYQPPKRGRASS